MNRRRKEHSWPPDLVSAHIIRHPATSHTHTHIYLYTHMQTHPQLQLTHIHWRSARHMIKYSDYIISLHIKVFVCVCVYGYLIQHLDTVISKYLNSIEYICEIRDIFHWLIIIYLIWIVNVYIYKTSFTFWSEIYGSKSCSARLRIVEKSCCRVLKSFFIVKKVFVAFFKVLVISAYNQLFFL